MAVGMSGAGGLTNVAVSPERAGKFRREGLWTHDTLAGLVAEHADRQRDAIAVIDEFGQRQFRYADLVNDSAAFADFLADSGVGAGSIVSMQLPNRYEAVVVAVAVQSLGAVINPLLPNYRARELTHIFRVATPRVVVTPVHYRGWDYLPMIHEVLAATSVDVIHVVDDGAGPGLRLRDILAAADGAPRTLRAPSDASAVSELIFTSGTEATPKGVMHGEENANFAVRTLFRDLDLDSRCVVWMPSPVGHSTGFNYGVRAALVHGCTLVLQDRWDPADAVALITQYGCGYTLAATTFLADLVQECERTGTRLPTLSRFGCGGAPVPPDLVARADACGIGVLRLYGSTEVLCATWNRPGDILERRMNTDGLPLSDAEIDIRDGEGKPRPRGEPGELWVRSAQASLGFFGDPGRTAAAYDPDGWIRTGDLATIDERGYLTIVGRKKEIIIRGGINIAPREIEDLVAEFPEVARAAVVGLPHPRLGEQACACVVLTHGATLDLPSLIARLEAAGLAKYKLPERLVVMQELPTTASGKVQKHILAAQLAVT